MNKNELAACLALKMDITKVKALETVNALVDIIGDSLEDGKDVSLAGFGHFIVRKTKARNGHNPKTGEEIKIKAGRKISFKVAKTLKDRMN